RVGGHAGFSTSCSGTAVSCQPVCGFQYRTPLPRRHSLAIIDRAPSPIRRRKTLDRMRLTYSLFSLVALGTAALVTPAMATSVSGTATFSGNATVNSNGVFFNDSGANVTNPYVVGSPNTG